MLTQQNLHGYQIDAIKHQLAHPESMLWLDMGLGKTVVTLTTVYERLKRGEIKRALVVAPLRVIQSVWEQESKNWCYLNRMKFSLIHGSEASRQYAADRPADIYLVNYEGLDWLSTFYVHKYLSQGKALPFQMIVFDEVSKMKNSTSNRCVAMAPLLQYIPYRTGLTGTPAGNGYQDLHGQYLMIDMGRRLGVAKQQFEHRFFHSVGYMGYKKALMKGGDEMIKERIADITMQMSAAQYLTLPKVSHNNVWIDLPMSARKKYNQLEKDLFTVLDDGSEIEVFNQASLTGKCLQAANGALYQEPGEPQWSRLHDAKLDALDDIIEESAGQQILVPFCYRHDAERIMKRHPNAVWVSSKMKQAEFLDALARWKSGDLDLLIGHPGSMAHGIDGLQHKGHIVVWFGVNWSLELYLQANGRINRQGQKHPVMIHHILARDTLDLAVMEAIEGKHQTQEELRATIMKYRYTK